MTDNVTYQVIGDLLTRKNKILATGIVDKKKCKDIVETMSRKGWINLKIVEIKSK